VVVRAMGVAGGGDGVQNWRFEKGRDLP
jgi:hypothetical protein